MITILMREARAEFLSVTRQPAFAIPTLAFPVMFYLFFALVFTMSRSMHMPTWLLATYGVFGIMGPAMFGFGAGIASERAEGWLRLKRVMPVSPLIPLAARMMMAMMFAFIVFALLAALGALFGDVRMPRTDWIRLALVLSIGALPFGVLGLVIGLAFGAKAAPVIVNLLYLPMAFLSGLWVPLMAFPEWLQQAAVLLPPYHLAAIALHVVGAQPAGGILVHVGVLVVFTVACIFVAAVAWRRVREE